MTTAAPEKPATSGGRKPLTGTLIGLVVSDKRDKTRTVAVDFQQRHPKYGKYLHRSTKYQVHDPANAAHQGDRVEIANCRPISKTKSWRLVRIVQKAPMPIDAIKDETAPAGE
jgi:small subunit ribosomal protein S17